MAKPFTEWTVLPHGALSHVDDRILSVTGELHMPPMGEVIRRMTVVRMRLVKDRAALCAQLDRWAHMPDLERVIISHGAIIASEPARVLEEIAEQLAA